MTISFRATLGLALCCALAAALPASLHAQDSPAPKIEGDLQLGFAGVHKLGKWTELKLSLVGGSAAVTGLIRVETPDGTGAPYATVSSQPVRLLPGQRSRVVVPVCLGGPQSPLAVAFDYKTDDGTAGRVSRNFGESEGTEALPLPEPNATSVIVQLGPNVGLKEAVASQRWEEATAPKVVTLESTDDLPQRWYGYDGVDLVVLSPGSPALYDGLSDVQREALLEWVRRGGRVLAAAGASAAALYAPGRPLADFAPGRFDRVYPLASSREFEDFAQPAPRLFPSPDTRVDAALFADAAGKVVVAEKGSVPLIVRRAMNFGEIVYVAVDLHEPVFVGWEGIARFYNRLLGWTPLVETADAKDESANQQFMQQHISDLATDLRVALEKFDVWPPPFLLVVGMILGYVLLIGPGDYFLLKRLGRMELTWVTFPAIVVLVSLGAYWMARASRGDKLKVNQVNVVDCDATAKNVRGTTIANIFTPYSSTYDLALAPALPRDPATSVAPPPAETLLTWFGVPEDRAFGGMGNRNSRPILGSAPYLVRPDAGEISGAPILTASTKAFVGRWRQPGELLDAKITLQTDRNAGDLLSDVVLTNRLTVPLQECVLYYAGDSYDLPDLEPGVRWSGAVSTLDRKSLTDRLTDMRQVVDVARNTNIYQRRPYAVAAGREEDVLTAMMFYSAIGGGEYTKLSNEYLGHLDLSRQLECGRAIIVCVARTPAAGLTSAAKPFSELAEVHDHTVYRFLVDVTK